MCMAKVYGVTFLARRVEAEAENAGQLRADPDGRQRGGIGDLLRTGRLSAPYAADDFHCGTAAAGNRAHHRIAADDHAAVGRLSATAVHHYGDVQQPSAVARRGPVCGYDHEQVDGGHRAMVLPCR